MKIGNGMGKPMGIAPATRTRTRRTILPEYPRVTGQNEPKNIQIGQVLREICSEMSVFNHFDYNSVKIHPFGTFLGLFES